MALTEDGYLARMTDAELARKLRAFGAVCVEGPKWCGKTWSALNQAESAVMMGDPAGNFNNRRLAQLNPEFVLEGAAPRLVDEWQEVPEIWDAVRQLCDRSRERGRFLLSSSTTPPQYGVRHSGTGRIARMRMHTMSLYESGASSGVVSLSALFEPPSLDGGLLVPVVIEEPSLDELIDLVTCGGWPGVIGLDPADARQVPIAYLDAVRRVELPELDGIKRNPHKIDLVLRSLGRNESTLAGASTLARDIREEDDEKVDTGTITDYLAALDKLFLLDNAPAFDPNMRSSVRVGKKVKRHFCDPSLAVAAMGATPATLKADLHSFGFLFEALCERDLRIYCQAIGAKLFHYRDGRGREIDAVVEMEDGRWAAFEVKLGMGQIDDAARGLVSLSEEMRADPHAQPPEFAAVICGIASAAYTRPDGVHVIPITALRP